MNTKELYDKLNKIALKNADITEIELHKPMNTKEQWEEEFDKKFAIINHIHRGECAITDITGTIFQAHTDDNGLITQIGGLESIKNFIRETMEQAYQKGLDDGYDKGFRDCEKGVTP